MAYRTRQDLMDEIEEKDSALGEILDEAQSLQPDLDRIEETASEAFGVEVEAGGGDEEDED